MEEVDGQGTSVSDGLLSFPEFVKLVASATTETACLAGRLLHAQFCEAREAFELFGGEGCAVISVEQICSILKAFHLPGITRNNVASKLEVNATQMLTLPLFSKMLALPDNTMQACVQRTLHHLRSNFISFACGMIARGDTLCKMPRAGDLTGWSLFREFLGKMSSEARQLGIPSTFEEFCKVFMGPITMEQLRVRMVLTDWQNDFECFAGSPRAPLITTDSLLAKLDELGLKYVLLLIQSLYLDCVHA